MPITVVCSQCGKSYAADESLAGRRVRCRGCGNILTLPTVEVGEPPDLDALSPLDRHFPGNAMVATHTAAVPGDSPVDPTLPDAPFDQPQLPAGMEDVPLSGEGIEAAGRRNVRFAFLGSRQVDLILPWFLVVASIAWFVIQTRQFNFDSTGKPGPGWVTLTRVAGPLIAYTILVCPLTFAILKQAGRRLNFQLPRTARFRTFASYLPAMTLTLAIWMMGGGTVIAFVMGMLIGLVLSSGFLWILFRLRAEEMPATVGMGATGFAAGAVLSAVALGGVNELVKSVVESTQSFATVPTSPVGSGFSWPAAARPPVPQPSPRPRPAPGSPPVAEVVPLNPQNLSRLGPAITRSPFPGTIQTAIVPPADNVLVPLTPSPFVAAVRREGDRYVTTRHTSDPNYDGGPPLRLSAGETDTSQMCISPDGQLLARWETFPTKQIAIYRFGDADVPVVIRFPTGEEAPRIVGFTSATTLLTRREGAQGTELEFFDAATGNRRRSKLALPMRLSSGNALAVSAAGRFIAVSGIVNNEPRLQVYSTQSDDSVPAPNIRIESLDARWASEPTALAFNTGPDDPEHNLLVIMFENAGEAVALAYRQSNAGRIGPPGPDRSFTIDVNARAPGGWTGSAIQWIGSAERPLWLLYGRAIVDPISRRTLATLDMVEINRCTPGDDDSVIFHARVEDKRVLGRAVFDLDAIGGR